jgi:hypothetical protein
MNEKFKRFSKEIIEGLIGSVIIIILMIGCKLFLNNDSKSYSFPHHIFLDNPKPFKGDTLIGVFHYNGTDEGISKLGDLNTSLQRSSFEDDYIIFKGYKYDDNISNRLDVDFILTKGLNVPNVSYQDEIEIKFVSTEGSHHSGNKVISISRKKTN